MMSKCDRARFSDYIRGLSCDGPASLLPVAFEPEVDSVVPVDLYLTAGENASEYLVGLKVNHNPLMIVPDWARETSNEVLDLQLPGQVFEDTDTRRRPADHNKQPCHQDLASLHSAPTALGMAAAQTICPEGGTDCLLSTCNVFVEGDAVPRHVDQVVRGDRVMCHDRVGGSFKYAEVTAVRLEKPEAKWLQVSLADGTSLTMTEDHPVSIGRSGWRTVSAVELKPGEHTVMVLRTTEVPVSKVQSCTPRSQARAGSKVAWADDSELQGPRRVFLTVHQPERHSVFVAPESWEKGLSAMAVGSADLAAVHVASTIKNSFIDFESDSNDIVRSYSDPCVCFPGPLPSFSEATSTVGRSTVSEMSDGQTTLCLGLSSHWQRGQREQLGLTARQQDEASLSDLISVRRQGFRSVGSALHKQGNCQICVFEHRHIHQGAPACFKGSLCSRCHEHHPPSALPARKRGRQKA